MKKILSVLLVVVVVAVAAVYYVSDNVAKNYEKTIGELDKIDGIKISNSMYEKGLFDSNATFDLIVSKDLLDKIDESAGAQDLVFKVDTELKHGLTALFSGAHVKSKIFIQNDFIKNMVSVFLGSNLIMTADANVGFGGSKDVLLNLSDIDFKDNKSVTLTTKGVSIAVDLDPSNKAKSVKFNVSKAYIENKDENFSLNMENAFADIDYEQPFVIDSVFDWSIVPYASKSGFKIFEISADNYQESIKINIADVIYDSVLKINNGLANFKENVKAAGISVNDSKYKELALDAELLNFDVSVLEDYIKNLDKELASSDFGGYEEFLSDKFKKDRDEFLSSDPIVKVNSLTLKNVDNNALNLNLTLGFKGYDKKLTDAQNIKSLIVNGKINIDTTLAEFFGQIPEVGMFEPMLKEGEILKSDGKGVKTEFKFDKDKMDIIFNEKVGLFDLIRGF
ncbi:DUF945 family protein [Campylobacter curvus]|uniref:DUF945 domain-containing protein n=1 Tax=Campylobacter curvus (strain 525.92) TaxID=360105 RepID=A7GY26_CAMC5|nr:DUF945 family protein [Campylobacter curvus]EAU00466.1 putative protein (DUF945 domain) [Campylobacter curvus 525.92]